MAKEAYKHDPWSIELEQNLLGSLLADNSRLDKVAGLLTPQSFYDPMHGRLFGAILSMVGRGNVVTPLTLHANMKSDPGVIETGGQAYLDALRSAAPAMPNVRDFANLLSDLQVRRGLIHLGEDIVSEAHEPPSQDFFPKLMSSTMDRLMGMSRSVIAPAQLAEDVARLSLKRVEDIRSGLIVPGIPTFLSPVDRMIGGMQAGDLIIIAGRPGMAKSALMGGISLHAATAMHPTLVFSLEMFAAQWVERNITDLDFDGYPNDPIPYQLFRTGNFTDAQMDRIALAATRLNNIPLEICDTPHLTMDDIGARARAFRSKYPDQLCLIVVDYLQIIQAIAGKDRSREQEVGSFARGLKALAKSIGCPVVAGAQMLTKGGDPRMANKEQIPTLAGIRESGNIEAEADIVAMPHRKAWFLRKNKPDLPADDPEMLAWEGDYNACKNLLKLYLPKFRHGEDGEVDLFADMRSSSVRTEKPYSGKTGQDQGAEAAGQDLLASLSPYTPT